MTDTTITLPAFPPLAPAQPSAPENAWHAAAIIAELTGRIETLTQQLATANQRITDGGDPRLVDFWQRAMEAATDAEFCSEYDRLAEELGGPRRPRDYSVRMRVTLTAYITRTVEAGSESEAEDQAVEEVKDFDRFEEFEDDWDDVTVTVEDPQATEE